MTAYYNEIDQHAAAWLRNLIDAGHIAPGYVDERSIEDVNPSDLQGFTQCHFFAGVGVWSHALRLSGWSDSRPAWTGSCPCQPFSAAGKGGGFDDERHLWPAFQHLIKECRPAVVFGEQVASKAVEPWIDLVHADLEALGYAFGCVPFPSAGVGAPHIRDRAYWVGHASSTGSQGRKQPRQRDDAQRQAAQQDGAACGLADANSLRRQSTPGAGLLANAQHDAESFGSACGLADTAGGVNQPISSWPDQRAVAGGDGALQATPDEPGPTNGFWRDADWLGCRDGKWRPVEARVQQMVDGTPLRVGPLCPNLQIQVEEKLNETSNRLQIEAGEVLREVREAVNAAHLFEWGGGVRHVHEAQILLARLLEYTGQDRQESDSANGTGPRSGPKRDLRVLWRKPQIGDSSYQRELARQQHQQFADSLRLLSSTVARFASEAGYPCFYEDAPASFPLGAYSRESGAQNSLGGIRSTNRTSRLRAYGNAINAKAAQAFIEAVMECAP